MTRSDSHLEIAYSSIQVFLDNGQLDLNELNFLLGLALRDNVVDEDEKRVLASLFRRAEEGKLTSKVIERISEARLRHGIPH